MQCALLLVLIGWGVLAQGDWIQTTTMCGTHCSQGLHCKAKQHFPIFLAPCKTAPVLINSSVFHHLNVSTVMKCEQKQKCSLHLKVTATVQINELLRGVSVCTDSAGMLEHCRVVTFPKTDRARLAGQLVEVQDDCFEVSPSQNVNVMLKTFPEYCDMSRVQVYRVQGCDNADLRSHVPSCITGKIAYAVDMDKQEISVGVSDILEDRSYHLRLCRRWDICSGTEAYTLLKREDPYKNATLHFSSPLPCLCIEGWSSVVDAPRVQVCPFKDRTEELWSGVTFDSEREALSWEPGCPVKAVISLCQRKGESICEDLPNSTQVIGRRKVTYAKVDPHPTLCMKFTTDARSWIKCPFADGHFPVWDLTITAGQGPPQAALTSRINTELSLQVCQKDQPSECQDVTSVTVEKMSPVPVNLTGDVCQSNVCIRVKRADVQFSTHVLQCHFQCTRNGQRLCRADWVFVTAFTYVTLMIVAGLAGNIMLTVYQKRRASRKQTSYHQCEHTAEMQPTEVTLLAADSEDHAQQSSRDLEKLLLGFDASVTFSDSVKDQQALTVRPQQACGGSLVVEKFTS
ncbi:putative interleukin-17 receptor E-like isoform X1 [Conger conger]|uniref:putative interleukin-17 receptor E-like isoform X1 n=1 Tax=Conger conger TaxID=82655 RepID=UPI002A5ABE3E|nr:putative interleukin-17 receptor E-like isoform X1 [Conger conger]